MHPRQIIRDAVVATLVGQTAAGAKVKSTRKIPTRKSELPSISVYSEDEKVDRASQTTAPRELDRETEVRIAGWVGFGDDVDDRMDDLALEIETAMHADPYLGGAAGDSFLIETQTTVDPEGDTPMGLIVLTYAVTYYTLAPPAPTIVDDFRVADATTKIGGAGDDNTVRDEIVVQEAPP